jgi:signal transduction histidine kinase
LIASLVLFELLALGFFSAVLLKERSEEAQQRMVRRLEYQVSEVQVVTRLALRDKDTEMLSTIVVSMLQFPTIASADVTDPNGVAIASSDSRRNGTQVLTAEERGLIPRVHGLKVFPLAGDGRVAVTPVQVDGRTAAYIWLYPKENAAQAEFREALRVSILGAIAVILSCSMLAAFIAGSLTRPLTRLIAATRAIIRNPEDTSSFPLQVRGRNEAADLTIAFNLMVASIEEQRRGLSDTLSLLDSMLANAPIGIAFFDRQSRFVRVNYYLAQSHPSGVARFLGRRVDEVLTPEATGAVVAAIDQVFEHGTSVQGLEVSGLDPTEAEQPCTWLLNVYPVRTAGQVIRWAGMVLIDITQRLRTEHALRETEKLAVTGRLSASIAHEINNPLEAVTNLLYLLLHHGSLGPEAEEWAKSAQHQVARVSDITQQTLRFYRQSSRPSITSLPELIDSVLTLHQGRLITLQVTLHRRYRGSGELLCFAGELRQLFANLIGNALDAMQPSGGVLTVSVRKSRSWLDASIPGVRVTVADTGCGMSPGVLKRIFEPFYTTKEATGTGLGLWVSSEIMAKHKVTLRIRSRAREDGMDRPHRGGTVFMLFFPSMMEDLLANSSPIEAQSVA